MTASGAPMRQPSWAGRYALFQGDRQVGAARDHAYECFGDARALHGLVRIHGDEQLLNGVSPTMSDRDGSWGLLAGFSIKEVL